MKGTDWKVKSQWRKGDEEHNKGSRRHGRADDDEMRGKRRQREEGSNMREEELWVREKHVRKRVGISKRKYDGDKEGNGEEVGRREK